MATSRAKTTHRRFTRKANSGTPAKNAVRRKKRTAARKEQRGSPARSAKRAPTQAAKRTRKGNDFPNWRDLATSNERVPSRSRLSTHIDNVSTVRFGLLLLAVALVFTLYVGHVYATQDALADVQRARRENLQLHLRLNQLKGDFDRATGPAVVYLRARATGLEEGIEYGPTIEIEGD
jgi:hypothetical protein